MVCEYPCAVSSEIRPVTICHVSGPQLNAEVITSLWSCVRSAVRNGARLIVFDCKGVDEFTLDGLKVLSEIRGSVAPEARFVLTGLSPRLVPMLRRTSFGRRVELASDIDVATAVFSAPITLRAA